MNGARRTSAAEARVTYVWVVLSGLTVLGWVIARIRGDGDGDAAASGLVTVVVLAIAGVKGRLILQEYMEVRTAPRWLRHLTDAWLAILLALLVGIYFWL
jgi:hypothetical protein